jgi:hypothetical protein
MTDSLRLLLDAAEPAVATAIREMARSHNLLWQCDCDHEGTHAEETCGKCGTLRASLVYNPKPGTEYTYPISDYARETARVLGMDTGWGSESGYIGAYGLIWGPDVPTLLLHVTPGDDGGLVVQLNDDFAPDVHEIDLPDGAPSTEKELRTVARRIASVIRLSYT